MTDHDKVFATHQLEHYSIEHNTLESIGEVVVRAIRRLRTSSAEEARELGSDLEEVYLDLKAEMRRNCDLYEIWGETLNPPAPRQPDLAAVQPFRAVSTASEG